MIRSPNGNDGSGRRTWTRFERGVVLLTAVALGLLAVVPFKLGVGTADGQAAGGLWLVAVVSLCLAFFADRPREFWSQVALALMTGLVLAGSGFLVNMVLSETLKSRDTDQLQSEARLAINRRVQRSFRAVQWRDIDLSNMHLGGTGADRYDLSFADLTGAKLVESNLRGALLDSAILSRADLTDADLAEASLRNAALDGADLSGANLAGADLEGARGLRLEGAVLSARTRCPGGPAAGVFGKAMQAVFTAAVRAAAREPADGAAAAGAIGGAASSGPYAAGPATIEPAASRPALPGGDVVWPEQAWFDVEAGRFTCDPGGGDGAPSGNLAFLVASDARVGTIVGRMRGADSNGGELTYRMRGGNNNQAFAIDAATGVLTVANELLNDRYTLEIGIASANGVSDDEVAVVVVGEPAGEISAELVLLVELDASRGRPIGVVDAGFEAAEYEVLAGGSTSRFLVDDEGMVRVDGSLDAGAVYRFEVKVRELAGDRTGGRAVTVPVVVEVISTNRRPSVPLGQRFDVAVGAGPGTFVGRVEASDPDGDGIRFAVLGDAPFEIHPVTGDLLTTGAMTEEHYEVDVEVSDDAKPPLAMRVVVRIDAGAAGTARIRSQADAYVVARGGTLEVDAAAGLLANDERAAGGQAVAAKPVLEPTRGDLRLGGDGAFTYVHNGSGGDSDSFTYQAFAGARSSPLTDVLIQVIDPPSAGSGRIEPAPFAD